MVEWCAAARQRCRAAASLVLVLSLGWSALASAAGAQRALPASSLAMRTPAGWETFWTSASAPGVWRDAPLARVIRWRAGASGIDWGELDLAGSGEAWRTRLVVARVRPERVIIALDTAFTADRMAAWTIDRANASTMLAVNAGQFEVSMPWGWVVIDGHEWLAPGFGPLSAALVGMSDGSVHWLQASEIATYRMSHARGIRWAFQSYPALLVADSVPLALRERGHDVDLAHRDARAAICIDRDDRIVVALTRFNALGSTLGFVPFGLTTPEMAGVMGALGCRDAMLLDGGISAQLMLRGADGRAHAWHGVREVPVGLVMRRR